MAANNHGGALTTADVDHIALEDVSADFTSNNNTTVVRDRYGFFVTDEFRKYVNLPAQEIAYRKVKEGQRALKWVRMVKQWKLYESVPTRQPKLQRRCRKGIPDAVRGFAWYHLAKGDAIRSKFPNLSAIDVSGLNSTTSEEIERDIDRTFPRHVMFAEDGGAGQSALRRILRLYAVLDPEVGYCQGMGFLAALFLTYMAEDDAFYTFYSVLQRDSTPMRLMYLPKLTEIQKLLVVFERLCQQHLPVLWGHLSSEGMHPTMFFTEWAMTMFVRGFDFDLVTRVWDIFLLEGRFKIVYRVSLAILKSCEKDLLERKFDKIMAYVREIPTHVDAQSVLEVCWKIPLKTADIEAHGREYEASK